MAAFACALTLAACGGEQDENPIPQDAGDEILAQLDEVEQQVDDGDCESAQATADEVARAIESLPDDVDGELRQTLVTASGRLQEQTRNPEQCVEAEPEPEPPPTGATGPEGETDDSEEDDG